MNSFFDCPVGEAVYYARKDALGLVYETYTFVDGPQARPGVSILLSNGQDVGGFNAQEADRFLTPLGSSGLQYSFRNVGQLAADYQRGVFDQAFHHARVLHLAYALGQPPAPAA